MQKRSRNIINNMFLSVLWKGVSVGLSFLVFPLTIAYLDVVEYGVWVTLFSVLNWINMLDVGIGLGMRNKLAEAISLNNTFAIKKYMSTGCISLSVIGIVLFVCFFIGINFINMQTIFNTNKVSEDLLYHVVFVTGIFVIMSFVLSIINNVFYAYQKANYTGIIQVIHNALMLVIIWILIENDIRNFLYFVYAYGGALIISRVIMIMVFFKNHIDLLPRFRFFDKIAFTEIFDMGVKFFIIQISCIMLFSSSNILITLFWGVEYVREYDVAFKIFSIVTMMHSLISTPLWNGYTDAYVRGDFKWIRQAIKRMLWLMGPLVCVVIAIGLFINDIVDLWLGQDVVLNPLLVFGMGIFVVISCWNNIFAMFVNGIGEVRLQMYACIFSVIVTVPLAIFMMKAFGTAGMILAISIVLIIVGLPITWQSYNILKTGNRIIT